MGLEGKDMVELFLKSKGEPSLKDKTKKTEERKAVKIEVMKIVERMLDKVKRIEF